MILPFGPEPDIEEISTPASFAEALASGLANTLPPEGAGLPVD